MVITRDQIFTVQGCSFALGELVVTSGVVQTIHAEDCQQALQRYTVCDWGSSSVHDWEENALGLDNGWSLFALYYDRNGTPYCIVTEADRSVTTILLPDEHHLLPR